LADHTSDLDFLLQINEALAGIGASASTAPPAAAEASAAPAAEAAVPEQATPNLKDVPHDTLADAAAGTAAPQPQLSLEAGIAAPHANGVIAAGQTSLSPDAKQTSAATAAAAGTTVAAASKADGAKAAPKAFKGFLKSTPGSSKPSGSTAPAAKAPAAASSGSSGSSGTAATTSSSDTVEINCAEQQKQHKQQRAASVSFGEEVAQQQQHSVMLTLAINQVRPRQHSWFTCSPFCFLVVRLPHGHHHSLC
jgi:hypothetical protein